MGRAQLTWLLVKHEFRRHVYKYWFIVPLTVYFAWVSGLVMKHMQTPGDSDYITSNVMSDYFFLLAVGSLGVSYMRESFYKSVRLCSQSKRLSFLRQLPIEANTLVIARQLTALLHLTLIYPVFYIALYLSSPALSGWMTPVEYIEFALTWSGITLLISSLYVYWELGFKEKLYFIYSIVFVVVLFAIPSLAWISGIHLVETIILNVKRSGLALPLISLAVGAGSVFGSVYYSGRRILTRDLEG